MVLAIIKSHRGSNWPMCFFDFCRLSKISPDQCIIILGFRHLCLVVAFKGRLADVKNLEQFRASSGKSVPWVQLGKPCPHRTVKGTGQFLGRSEINASAIPKNALYSQCRVPETGTLNVFGFWNSLGRFWKVASFRAVFGNGTVGSLRVLSGIHICTMDGKCRQLFPSGASTTSLLRS